MSTLWTLAQSVRAHAANQAQNLGFVSIATAPAWKQFQRAHSLCVQRVVIAKAHANLLNIPA